MTKSILPASVQFYDNLSTIEAMLERRFSMKRIWQTLKDDDLYTGDYTHFCRLAKKELEGKKQPFNREKRRGKITTSAKKNEPERSSNSLEKIEPEESEDDGPLMFMDDLTSPIKK